MFSMDIQRTGVGKRFMTRLIKENMVKINPTKIRFELTKLFHPTELSQGSASKQNRTEIEYI